MVPILRRRPHRLAALTTRSAEGRRGGTGMARERGQGEPSSGDCARLRTSPIMRPTVLMVDDHDGFRARARAMLEAQGFDVVAEAADGHAGLAAAERLRPDIALVDIGLPDLDGFDVAARLRLAGSVACIVLTSGRDRADFGARVDGLRRGRVHRQGRPLGRPVARVARLVTPRAAARLALLVPVLALAAGLILFAHDPPFAVAPLDYLFDAATGVVIAVAGLVAWDRRPGWRTGPLLVLAGYLWYVGSLYVIAGPDSLVPFLGFALRGYYDVILAFVVLAVPGDRLRTRLDRGAVWFLLAAMVVRSAWRLIGTQPGVGPGYAPTSPPNPILLVTDLDRFIAVDVVLSAIVGLALFVVAGAAVRRLARSRRGARRVTDPVLIGGALWAALGGLYALSDFVTTTFGAHIVPADGPGWTAQYVIRVLGPLGLLLGMARLRTGSSAAVALLAGAEGPPRAAELEQALRQALGDPALQLLYPTADGGWVTGAGQPASLPIARRRPRRHDPRGGRAGRRRGRPRRHPARRPGRAPHRRGRRPPRRRQRAPPGRPAGAAARGPGVADPDRRGRRRGAPPGRARPPRRGPAAARRARRLAADDPHAPGRRRRAGRDRRARGGGRRGAGGDRRAARAGAGPRPGDPARGRPRGGRPVARRPVAGAGAASTSGSTSASRPRSRPPPTSWRRRRWRTPRSTRTRRRSR